MTITIDQMERMFTGSGKYTDSMNQTITNYNVNNVPMFIAQIGHESAELRVFEENLNYSAEGLLDVFDSYFDQTTAAQYAHKPEAIANRVYANRMGNGPESSGDGWNYRGRGAIQITGKNNYLRFGQDVGMSLDQVMQYIETDDGRIMSAGWYWYDRNINSVSDNINLVTEKINGGLNGLQHRQELYTKAKQIFVG